MPDQFSLKGFWSLICDCETESTTCSTKIDTMLKSMSKLQDQLPELFPILPKAKKYNEVDSILVFTSAYSDEEIKKSAEIIRSNVDYPFVMYFFKIHVTDSKDTKMQYKHTPDGEFYKFRPNDNTSGCAWKLISMKKKTTSILDVLLPSQVLDKDRIHLPADEEDFKSAINEKGGKWILHCSNLETLDYLWENLNRLYDTGVLVGLKSSTAKFSITEINPKYQTKAIMCYTADADCKRCVKRAAQSIFICTGYNFVMYYKSNEASCNGQYRHEGAKGFSKYMFSSGGELFEKDYLGRWKKTISDEGLHK